MCKRYLPGMLVALVICSMCGGRAALAATPTKTETARNERLRADARKLVRDAKAERHTPLVAVPQAPTGKSNNLSTGAKVAIGVGIVATILIIVFVVKSPILNDGR